MSTLFLQITRYLLISIFVFLTSRGQNNSQEIRTRSLNNISKVHLETKADSILRNLTLDEKIGQLFMIPAYSNQGSQPDAKVSKLVKDYHVGGIIFFKGYPTNQAILTNSYQSMAKIPLMIGIDGEWGLAMRLDSIISFPKQMTLGAVKDNNLIYQMGREVAFQCKRLGVHINFAPVADINNNPLNPVIHMRSFGEVKTQVANKAYAYMKGLQDGGVLAVAKHFPGHGDTDIDSHKDLPVIKFDYTRLDTLELYPFKYLISKGVKGVMVAHIQFPFFEKNRKLPATLSAKVINGILKDSLQFKGVVFTDALNMQGVTKYHKQGEIEVKALLAGNDVLLFPGNVPVAVSAIKNALNTGFITEDLINQKVKKIIIAKLELGVFGTKKINTSNIVSDINNFHADILKRRIIESAITLVKDDNSFIPVNDSMLNSIVSLAIGPLKDNLFQKSLQKYGAIKNLHVSMHEQPQTYKNYLDSINNYKLVIVSLHSLSQYNVKTFGISSSLHKFLNALMKKDNVVLLNFGSPYALKNYSSFHTILQVNENDDLFQQIAAQSVFGGVPVKGILPVSINSELMAGSGIIRKNSIRLKYSIPEVVGILEKNLTDIDTIIENAIENEETPGCQVLIAKNNTVIYNKAFGYQTYDKKIPVSGQNLFDIASVTKIAATMLSIMHLYEKGDLKLSQTVADFFTDTSEFSYKDTRIKEMLLHEAGFEPWIAFYKQTTDKQKMPSPEYFSKKPIDGKRVRVTGDLYAINTISDTIWKVIYETEINKKGEYSYSDLDFIFLKRIIDSIIQTPFDLYLDNNYYKPLGMNYTTFNPSDKFPVRQMVPAEDDKYFRQEVIQGYVHDPAAALLGGISGHAGLFSNVNDLAKLAQMWLNGGMYGTTKYFEQQTINYFTANQSNVSRRGLGFDKPERNPDESYSPASRLADTSTYGHTGFTGTCIWIDPKNELVYIFLSNRTFPDALNKSLIKNNTRNRIHDLIYEAIRQNTTHQDN